MWPIRPQGTGTLARVCESPIWKMVTGELLGIFLFFRELKRSIRQLLGVITRQVLEAPRNFRGYS